MAEKRENWGSRIGFIFAAAGFSIGLGNIWRFPYLVGKFGGGAFILVYVAICVIIGLPLFIAELGIGRKAHRTPIVGFKELHGSGTPWTIIGWVGCIACILLMSYYMVIIGWMFAYFVRAVSGAFTVTEVVNGVNAIRPVGANETKAMFETFMNSPMEMAGYTLFVVIALGVTVTQGLKDGVERCCKWMLPILGIMLIVLAIRSITMSPQADVPGAKTAMEGLAWYIKPDFSKLSGEAVLAALGQSFFSIGIGIATAIVYGSYLKEDSNIPVDACWIISMDTSFAVIAGLFIFPALFCFGMDPESRGFGLVFETLPIIFGTMEGGRIWGSMFFFLAALAGFTSAIGYLEAPAASFAERFGLNRKNSTLGVLIAMFLLGIPSILSKWSGSFFHEYKIKGRIIFDFMDYLSGDIMMPVCALLVAIYVSLVWKFENYQRECNVGATGLIRVASWWSILVKFIIPIALFTILWRGL